MRSTMLRGRPEERFKFIIGFFIGVVLALPVNVLVLTKWEQMPEFGYLFIGIILAGMVFRRRASVVGASSGIFLIGLPQAIAVVLPTPLTNWHVSAGILWLIAFAILVCLYLMREAETRTDADVDAYWLFSPEE